MTRMTRMARTQRAMRGIARLLIKSPCLTVAEYAEEFEVAPSRASYLLRALIKDGHAGRVRARMVGLTDRGNPYIHEMTADGAEHYRDGVTL